MSDPATLEEYQQLSLERMRYSGYGAETKCHAPCPFCAAPDFAEWLVVRSEYDAAAERTCRACGRSAKALISRGSDGGLRFEVVQTGGADPPAYLPKMRRVPA